MDWLHHRSAPRAQTGVAPLSLSVRRLTAADADAYQALRLRALGEYPQAFTSDVDEEAARVDGWAGRRLSPDPAKPHDFFIGAFAGEALVGMVGLSGRYRAKERHSATVVGMFVAAEAAGKGIGMALLQALLASTRQWVELEQLDLTVTEGNHRAQRLYERCGFEVWGVLPRAIRVNGQNHAKVHMVLSLTT